MNKNIDMVFSQKKIYLVIALTIAALVGIVVVQFFWIESAFNTQQDQFNDRFVEVRNQLEQNIKADSSFHKALMMFTSAKLDTSLTYSTPSKNEIKNELKAKINPLFQKEFTDTSYEFGLVSHTGPHHSDSLKNEHILYSTMGKADPSPLLKSKYRTCQCISNSQSHINFYFPNKDYVLAAQIWEMLGLSILCILLVVGCFAYTIYTIRKQKKLAQMKNDFINNMTHEFKTPIFSISLASKSMRKIDEISESPKIKKYLNLIDDENRRLKDQVNKVLQMALVDSKKSTLNKDKVDIHTLIKGVTQSFDLMLEERNGTIELQLNADKHLIKADETHLSNIFHSLIDNAIKYSEDQPHITITTEDKEDGVCFNIADNGIGMDSKTQKHIFDKFYRAQSGDRHDVKGFGLGLSYVKNIVQAHQGWIKLKSKLNKGSTFTIFLPA